MEENNHLHIIHHQNDHIHDIHDDDVEIIREEESGVGGSRWNPTKEQIEMLERMYSEGLRTPSAEQIKHITARLRVYGHIEGKNVFYWFQNHKARQRQKQRQDRLAAAAASSATSHINRFLGHHHYHHRPNPSIMNGLHLNPRPIFPAPPAPTYLHHYPPNPNVICSPYYKLPHSNISFHPPHPAQHHYSAPLADYHGIMTKRSTTTKPSCSKSMDIPLGAGVPHASTLSGYCAAMLNAKSGNNHDAYHYQDNYVADNMGTKTLNLFPVHPTGILEHKLGSSTNNSAANSSAASSSSDTNTNGDDHHRFFDFFSSGHASCESG